MRCCPLLLAAAILAAGDAAAPVELKLDAQPAQMQSITELTFGGGRARTQTSRLELTISARLPKGGRLIDTGQVEVVEVLTDTGAKLALAPDSAAYVHENDGHIQAVMTLQAPPPGCRSLQRVVVAAEATTAQPGLRKAVIKPAKAWIAKRLRLEGYQDAEIELEDLAAETLTLGMTPAMLRCIDGLVFRSAAGAELEASETNDSEENAWHIRHVKIALPADGQIELRLLQGVTKQRLLLTATAIPLTLPTEPGAATILPTETIPQDGAAPVEAPPVKLQQVEGKPGF